MIEQISELKKNNENCRKETKIPNLKMQYLKYKIRQLWQWLDSIENICEH
jgi:uncharacterized protein YaaN involved in tellurite resistance